MLLPVQFQIESMIIMVLRELVKVTLEKMNGKAIRIQPNSPMSLIPLKAILQLQTTCKEEVMEFLDLQQQVQPEQHDWNKFLKLR